MAVFSTGWSDGQGLDMSGWHSWEFSRGVQVGAGTARCPWSGSGVGLGGADCSKPQKSPRGEASGEGSCAGPCSPQGSPRAAPVCTASVWTLSCPVPSLVVEGSPGVVLVGSLLLESACPSPDLFSRGEAWQLVLPASGVLPACPGCRAAGQALHGSNLSSLDLPFPVTC